jgi:hypothetical protein
MSIHMRTDGGLQAVDALLLAMRRAVHGRPAEGVT